MVLLNAAKNTKMLMLNLILGRTPAPIALNAVPSDRLLEDGTYSPQMRLLGSIPRGQTSTLFSSKPAAAGD